ncbi:MAG: 50S ribosomal protein L13 [Candidatus Gracilibacteria bacterium]|nr:50S ribosomal protein L13 [Candidatus Gracilibacteria bacterium]MDD4530801.1 50S ribosomal protein L13 [Candidatus Gracilibacteria bacterium]
MKTIMPKQLNNIERKWYVFDAKDQVLGRLANEIVKYLTGKNKVDFARHVDNGDYVVVLNASKFITTGNKEEGKLYRTHSGYLGGIKEANLKELRVKKPFKALELAISGMIPKNKLRKDVLLRLKLVEGESHDFQAQKPTEVKL